MYSGAGNVNSKPTNWKFRLQTVKNSHLDCHCTLHVEEEGSLVCWSPFLLCREKAASLLQETSQFLLNLEVDQKQDNGRHLKVCWSTWLHWGGEHRHVISQPFHFQEDSFCDCVIIRNLHPWGFMTRIITKLHDQKRGGKGVCKGPEQVLNHRSSLWLSHLPTSDLSRLLSCWAVCYAQANDAPWQNINQLVFFFSYEVPSIVSGLLCYLTSYKLPDIQKNLRNLQMPGDKTCHFKFYIPLRSERLVFILHLNNASCQRLYVFSSPPTSAI